MTTLYELYNKSTKQTMIIRRDFTMNEWSIENGCQQIGIVKMSYEAMEAKVAEIVAAGFKVVKAVADNREF